MELFNESASSEANSVWLSLKLALKSPGGWNDEEGAEPPDQPAQELRPLFQLQEPGAFCQIFLQRIQDITFYF